MALDGLVIHALVRELQSCKGGRINKIHQPSPHDIVLQIRAQGENKRLLLSANPTYPRAHFSKAQFLNPLDAPMFCMLMRKHCEGATIESIEQVGTERMIHMRVRQRDELGDVSLKTIIVELMGRHSNIILTDAQTGTILDGIHHVTPAISSYRIVMPGSSYTAPPEQGKADPLAVSEAEAGALLAEPYEAASAEDGDTAAADKPLTANRRIVARFSGISPLAAKEIAYRSGLLDAVPASAEAAASLAGAFMKAMDRLRAGQFEPVIVDDEATGKSYFSVLRLTHLAGQESFFSSISELLEAYYGDKAERDTVKQRVSDLLRFLHNERNKNSKKLDKLQETVEEAKDADKFRVLGELLTANMHIAAKGDSRIEVINYYEEDQPLLAIELDPQLTPPENAQRYFRKYTKSKSSLIAVAEQITATEAEIIYLDSLLQQLASASLSDIEEIRDELTEQGYIRSRARKGAKKKKAAKPQLMCFTSSEGIAIYVGKNNTQNEYLTNRLAGTTDTWLHTKDIPGSHVVIKSASFSETTLNEAAQLAAYYSQARESSRVPVDYTQIRHVRKPNGAKPGFVIYDHQKTLYVTPDDGQLKQLPYVLK